MPAQVDDLSWRDLFIVIGAGRDREEEREEQEWRRSLVLTQAVMNGYAKRSRPLDYLANRAFSRSVDYPGRVPTLEEYRKENRAYKAMMRKKHASR